jgi:peptidoglycan/LPS O-acetylase OafA/YrhL
VARYCPEIDGLRALAIVPVVLAEVPGFTGPCEVAHNGVSLYRDDDHLSVAGSLKVGTLFDPVLRQ